MAGRPFEKLFIKRAPPGPSDYLDGKCCSLLRENSLLEEIVTFLELFELSRGRPFNLAKMVDSLFISAWSPVCLVPILEWSDLSLLFRKWFKTFFLFLEKKDLVELVLQHSGVSSPSEASVGGSEGSNSRVPSTRLPNSNSWEDSSIRVSDQVSS